MKYRNIKLIATFTLLQLPENKKNENDKRGILSRKMYQGI